MHGNGASGILPGKSGCRYAVACAPVNLALAKYWGKRDRQLNLPINSSLSATLSMQALRTETICIAHDNAGSDEFYLDGKRLDVPAGSRHAVVVAEMRRRRELLETTSEQQQQDIPLSRCRLEIHSQNTFPTAAGLASSASGFAALVKCIAALYQLPSSDTELSGIARLGSGSASRSLHGGFAVWDSGNADDGSDSLARPIMAPETWPSLRVVVLIASSNMKAVSSTTGMIRSVDTSALLSYRKDQ